MEELADPHMPQPLSTKLVSQDKLTPATKQDIADLLQEMWKMHATDLDLIITEVWVVTTRIQALEEEILDLRQEAQGLKETVHQMLYFHSTLTMRVDMSEDQKRHTNVKIQGIPDSKGTTGLPHYRCHLINTFLPHAQA
ncbi:Hypothetical predicted protein [Pelobates cultripes]|uniref:Uncharacterized protein n=1 Tax=Pelobates cultripes TaxID=61616 RepID=A0AAD1WT56_PELCU|nr:Hypothetical predicted protein [Pelobates cultripes]